MILLKFSQRVAFFKYKAPKVIRENTPETMTYADLVTVWDKSRQDLKKFLESIPTSLSLSFQTRERILFDPIPNIFEPATDIGFYFV